MAAKRQTPFRDALFLLTTRNHLISALMEKHGFSRAEARQSVHELPDGAISDAAESVATDPQAPPTMGAGPILTFILQFIQSPAFAQLITILLGLLVAPKTVGDLPPGA
jgi:hypothetical protein